jgi:anti-sigma-K factor RskA
MNDELHVGESAGAYVLGALGPEEARDIEAHAAACPQCHQEIAALKRVVSVLPLACATVEPSSDLKARILAAGKGEDQVDAILRRAVVTSALHEPKRDVWHRPLPSWAGVAGWMGLAAACAVAGIFIGVANEHQRMLLALQAATGQPAALGKVTAQNAVAARAPAEDVYKVYPVSADQLEQAVAFIGESQVWDLSLRTQGTQMPCHCKVIQPAKASHAMIVTDMPMTKNGMVYQVWLVRKGKVHKGGIVMPGRMDQTTIPMKVQSGDVIAFSMEPPGGSAVPSGRFVMEQTL